MGLSFLQQLLTVASLAFASGLLLGIAVLRGEIGGLRAGAQASPGEASVSGRRRKRRRLTWSSLTKRASETINELDPALKWVLVALALLLTASASITRVFE